MQLRYRGIPHTPSAASLEASERAIRLVYRGVAHERESAPAVAPSGQKRLYRGIAY